MSTTMETEPLLPFINLEEGVMDKRTVATRHSDISWSDLAQCGLYE